MRSPGKRSRRDNRHAGSAAVGGGAVVTQDRQGPSLAASPADDLLDSSCSVANLPSGDRSPPAPLRAATPTASLLQQLSRPCAYRGQGRVVHFPLLHAFQPHQTVRARNPTPTPSPVATKDDCSADALRRGTPATCPFSTHDTGVNSLLNSWDAMQTFLIECCQPGTREGGTLLVRSPGARIAGCGDAANPSP